MPGWQQVHGGCREEIKGYMEEEIYFPGEYVVDIIHIASLMSLKKVLPRFLIERFYAAPSDHSVLFILLTIPVKNFINLGNSIFS